MHTLQSERTARGRQIIAALALAHLLEVDSPAAEWRITTDGKLCGHVSRTVDSEARRDMRTYATFFGGRLLASQGSNGHVEWVHLHVAATYRNTEVTVWTHVDVRPIARTAVKA